MNVADSWEELKLLCPGWLSHQQTPGGTGNKRAGLSFTLGFKKKKEKQTSSPFIPIQHFHILVTLQQQTLSRSGRLMMRDFLIWFTVHVKI